MAKYEVWGRKEIGKGKRQRLAYGLMTEEDARTAREQSIVQGWQDCVVTQRPARYGKIAGLQREGRSM